MSKLAGSDGSRDKTLGSGASSPLVAEQKSEHVRLGMAVPKLTGMKAGFCKATTVERLPHPASDSTDFWCRLGFCHRCTEVYSTAASVPHPSARGSLKKMQKHSESAATAQMARHSHLNWLSHSESIDIH